MAGGALTGGAFNRKHGVQTNAKSTTRREALKRFLWQDSFIIPNRLSVCLSSGHLQQRQAFVLSLFIRLHQEASIQIVSPKKITLCSHLL